MGKNPIARETVELLWQGIYSWDRFPRKLFDQYVEQIKDDHAHELAEQQRTYAHEVGDNNAETTYELSSVVDAILDTADLIDPLHG